MTKHHLVQIRPVVARAAFCESERDSAGRAKSLAPAMTTPHCNRKRCQYFETLDTRCRHVKVEQFSCHEKALDTAVRTYFDDRRVEVHSLGSDLGVPEL